MDWKIELVLVPVSDVDRAKEFYSEKCGFNVDVDVSPMEGMRVVQLTPPGSACSMGIGVGITDAAPGSLVGLHLVVSDITKAVDDLRSKDVEVSNVRHNLEGQWQDGPHPDHADYSSFSDFKDPDGNTWVLQEVGHAGR